MIRFFIHDGDPGSAKEKAIGFLSNPDEWNIYTEKYYPESEELLISFIGQGEPDLCWWDEDELIMEADEIIDFTALLDMVFIAPDIEAGEKTAYSFLSDPKGWEYYNADFDPDSGLFDISLFIW